MAEEVGDSNLLETWASSGDKVAPDVSKMAQGWLMAERPPYEYMNWLQNEFGKKLNHLLMYGGAEWNANTTYPVGAMVTHSGEPWVALIANSNSTPTAVNVNWTTAAGDVVDDTSPQLGGPLDANGNAVYLAQGTDVASAGELLVLTDGNSFDVTGTATITSIEHTADAFLIGSIIKLHFDAALTLTHHATDLVLLGGNNIVAAAGDVAEFQKYAAGDWRMVSFNGISSTADWEDGTSLKPSLASPADLAAAVAAAIAARTFLSTAQTITTAGALTIAHGRAAQPETISYYLECLTAEHGYAVGDRLFDVLGIRDTAVITARGMSVLADATNIIIRFANTIGVFANLDVTTGDTVALTNANWELYIVARI